MEWEVEYYKKENGQIPVLDFLLTLNPKLRAKTFSEIELLEKHGYMLREPYTKSIKGNTYKGLYELRVKFSTDITRIFYFAFRNNKFILLNGFSKKSDKTPVSELERAMRYKKDYERRCHDE